MDPIFLSVGANKNLLALWVSSFQGR